MGSAAPAKVNLAEKFALFSEHWSPRLAARYNGNEVRLARVEGDYHWHCHPDTDELFLVVEGELDIEFRDRVEHLAQGELIVVPRGVEHRPRATAGEAKLLVMDADGTPNTGDAATAFVPVEV
ncbi:cupin domain-containing protein [Alteriqipengyuania sp. NZ-12B]|uniref:Cupin domain-containing protein n=1 Tax=Alteriqipengyuania abyssalis TaxID=2860200 RepID=A0ABS7PG35_9SPHN|nr:MULTISPECIES: cupin domain-containing protein [Erythrobacteraceae]MBH1945336.1 cupin domain-containing protein [Erythrobacter sp. YJ-T3-07]MBY8338040.1 cupin domain-containing protein [Alteriqipengyuania abyssalis]